MSPTPGMACVKILLRATALKGYRLAILHLKELLGQ